ncbi:ParB/Srx family N-terminal domain-containing protein [Pantanalinema sp. GBBB05]|uniref:ParB/Srx family N-terminal domain-containing protein n=1 Tax=Pantanalinema sp. GBBB05 TaxID=2604139 RepID=UPI001DA30420|nr:hypothetical protein [Pantanalinema sp. GBBB05]
MQDWKNVEQWEINQVIPCDKNTKAHPPEQVTQLANIIRQTGWDVPIVVDESGIILKGHARRLAALELRLKTVPVIVRKGLSEEQKKAVRIADNKLAESDWLDSILAEEFQSLSDVDFDLELTGFDSEEIDAILEANELIEPEEANREKSEKRLQKKASTIKAVLQADDVAIFEEAIRATGNPNRSQAITEICTFYLNGRFSEEGQLHVLAES